MSKPPQVLLHEYCETRGWTLRYEDVLPSGHIADFNQLDPTSMQYRQHPFYKTRRCVRLEKNFFDGCHLGDICGYAHTEEELQPFPTLPPQQYQYTLYLEIPNLEARGFLSPHSFSTKGSAKSYVAEECLKFIEHIPKLYLNQKMSKNKQKKCVDAIKNLSQSGAVQDKWDDPEQWFSCLASMFGSFYPELMKQVKQCYVAPSLRHFLQQCQKDLHPRLPPGLLGVNLSEIEAKDTVFQFLTGNNDTGSTTWNPAHPPHPEIISRVSAAGGTGIQLHDLRQMLFSELNLFRTVKAIRLAEYLTGYPNRFVLDGGMVFCSKNCTPLRTEPSSESSSSASSSLSSFSSPSFSSASSLSPASRSTAPSLRRSCTSSSSQLEAPLPASPLVPGSGVSSRSSQDEMITRLTELVCSLQAQLTLVQSKLESSEDSRLCQICMEAQRDTVVLPCMHFMYCSNCTASLQHCPTCRMPIAGRLHCQVEK